MNVFRAWRALVAALMASAAFAAAGQVVAPPDCAAAKEPDRARCEQDKRVAQACAERTGEDLAACRKSLLSPPAREDCSRFPEGYGRNKCEDHNLKLDVEERCGAKTGDDLSRCYAEVMAKALKR